MSELTRREFLRYAAYGSALAGGGLLASCTAMGEKLPAGFAGGSAEKPLAVCISDFHIGEKYGGISRNPGHPDKYIRLNPSDPESPHVRSEFIDFLKYCKTLKQKHGKTRYLIILGDMWDMAMNNQESTFTLSAKVFGQLKDLKQGLGIGDLFEEVIYVPGNHDHHFWEMIQERYWVTERLEKGLAPLEMPRVVSFTLDASTGEIRHDPSAEESRIPVQNLASPLLGLDSSTPVHIAYPHIFLKKGPDDYALMTHGHLFEPDWNMVTIMFGDLMQKNGIPLTIRNIEMFNAITTDLHSYALGQTPPYEFWEKIYDLHFNNKAPAEWQKGIKEILKAHLYVRKDITGEPQTGSRKYHDLEALQEQRGLVEHYLEQAQKEFLNSGERITSLIYGHTHVPSFGGTFEWYHGEQKSPVRIHNTGGWVNINPDTFRMPQPTLVYRTGAVGPLCFRGDRFGIKAGQ